MDLYAKLVKLLYEIIYLFSLSGACFFHLVVADILGKKFRMVDNLNLFLSFSLTNNLNLFLSFSMTDSENYIIFSFSQHCYSRLLSLINDKIPP